MRKNIANSVALAIFSIMLFCSCSERISSTDMQPKATLAGKIYSLSEQPGSAKCEYVAVGTDYFSEYLFIDDSTFVEILHNCCPDIGEDDFSEDFDSETYLQGTYTLTDTQLHLKYASKTVVHYVAFKINPNSDSALTKERYASEAISPQAVLFKRINCMASPYFLAEDNKGEPCIAQSGNSIEEQVSAMRREGVWEKLFASK